MEEEKYGQGWEEEIREAVQKFEQMRRNNESYFFDVFEFESIIDYYIENNNSLKAFEAATLATSQHPNSVPIQIRKARVLLDKGKAVEALRILRKLENIEPGNPDIYISKGTALGILGDIQGAKKMFDFALSLDPDETGNILFSVVSVLQNLNYYEYVVPYLRKLMDLEPNYIPHLYDLAYAYEKTLDYDNSIEYYLKYLEEEPFSDSAWYNLGIIYNKLEMLDKALEAYEYALVVNSQNTFALFNKGNILCNLERFGEAVDVFHEYLDNEPDSFEGMTYLAECYEKSGNPLKAKKYYNDAIEIAPEYADPWFGLGIIEYNAGRIAESLVFFRKAVSLDDENPEFWYFLGKAHYANFGIKAALRSYREALKLDAYYSEVWVDIGMILVNESFSGKAIQYLEQASRITGDVPGINYLLASFYLRKGVTDKAYAVLCDALETDAELYNDFSKLFPDEILQPKIVKLLSKYRKSDKK